MPRSRHAAKRHLDRKCLCLLLAALRTGFADKPENIVTRGLAHILHHYPQVRHAWLNDLVRLNWLGPGDLTIIHQRGTAHGQPDLQGVDASGQIRILVEAKFDAGLTSNQPLGYLELLPATESGCLLFLVPSARIRPLYGVFCKCEGGTPTASMFVIHFGPRTLALQTWNATLELMLAAARNLKLDEAVCDLQQLRDLCKALEDDEERPEFR